MIYGSIAQTAQSERNAIINHGGGPAVVIAGPGTGKTTALAERIIYLCCETQCDPSRIFAITFTNASANEMRKKIGEICKEMSVEAPDVYVGTLHALAKKFLHKYGNKLGIPAAFRILHEFQAQLILRDMKWELRQKEWKIGRSERRYLKRFEAQRAFLPSKYLTKIAEIPDGNDYVSQEQFNRMYRTLLEYYKCIDWYDVVGQVVLLLRDYNDVLERVSSEIEHLIVDEYQDLNYADHQLIRLLSLKAKSLMVFGDDDQSIYQTGRFANPGGIRRFTAVYPNAKVYPLSICWRCGAAIMNAAWNLIDVSEDILPDRMLKVQPLTNPECGSGEFEILQYKSEKAEIQELCTQINMELEKEPQPHTVLILFHSKEIGQKYVDELTKNKLPVRNLLGADISRFRNILLLHELLRLIQDCSDNLAARYILQEVCRIEPEKISELRTISRKQSKSLVCTIEDIHDAIPEQITHFLEKLKVWRKMENQVELLMDIIRFLGHEDDPNMNDLIKWCTEEDDVTVPRIIEYLEKGGISKEEADYTQVTEDPACKVVVMSMHSAKGLTADVVIVPALEDEFVPNNWFEPEQRRLLYVAMTRARKKLLLSWAWSRKGKATFRKEKRAVTGRKRSRFLDEIKKN